MEVHVKKLKEPITRISPKPTSYPKRPNLEWRRKKKKIERDSRKKRKKNCLE